MISPGEWIHFNFAGFLTELRVPSLYLDISTLHRPCILNDQKPEKQPNIQVGGYTPKFIGSCVSRTLARRLGVYVGKRIWILED